MPYIDKDRRALFDESINSIVDNLGEQLMSSPAADTLPTIFMSSSDQNQAKGDLNYVIYRIVKKYIDKHGLKYHRINDFIGGTLTCCQMELYDRIARPYEDKAIQKNGDVE